MIQRLIILLSILMVACDGSGRPQKPDNLIAEEKMADILYDVFLLNSAKGINKKILENHGVMPQKYLRDKYGIDSVQFEKSNDYYAYDTKTYASIVSRVKEKIEAAKKINDSINVVEEKAQDSIRKAKRKLRESDSIPGGGLIMDKVLDAI